MLRQKWVLMGILAALASQACGQAVDAWGRPVGTREEPIFYKELPPAASAQFGSFPGRQDTPYAPAFAVRLDWVRSTFGTGIGATGLRVADIDGDGVREIVSGSSTLGFLQNSFWTVIKKDGATYDHTWVSPLLPAGLSCLRVVQYDADAALEIVVCSGSIIQIYDGKSLYPQRTIATAASSIRGLCFEDVDRDGTREFVFTDGTNLWIYDSVTGAQEFYGANLGGSDTAVGNMDADVDIEIAVARGSNAGYVLHGATRVIEWTKPSGFGQLVRAAQLDADPALELVAAAAWNVITAYDVDLRSPKFDIATPNDIAAVQVEDVDGDGSNEIVYGDGQWGSVRVFNGQTGVFKWSVANPQHGVTDIAFGNLDAHPAKELVFGAGFTSTGEDYLYVVDGLTRAIAWQSVDFSGPFYALDFGDVDLDGVKEILFGAFESKSGYDDGLYFVHDARTKRLEYTSPPATGSSWNGLWRVRNAQVDGDPQPEVFITASNAYDGFVVCYDGLTHVEQYRTVPLSGLSVTGLQIVDVDLDGQLEVVATVQREHTGATGTYVYVYDALTGALEWRSTSIGTYWANLSLLRIGNVDADPNPEIVVAEMGGALIVIDGVTHAWQLETVDYDITALDVRNIQGSSVAEIIVGTQAGSLFLVNPVTGAVSQTLGNYGARINGLAFAQVGGTAALDSIFCSGGRLRVRYATTSSVINWFGELLTDKLGEQDGLLAADVDGDGVIEVMLNADSRMVIYKMSAGPIPSPGPVKGG